jgi:hypothetical protein
VRSLSGRISWRLASLVFVLLWFPVPAHALRELSTDRPDRTESPYTVDRGHVQVEIDAVAWTKDDSRFEVETRALSLATMNLKFGLFARSDLQLVLGTWSEEKVVYRGIYPDCVGCRPGDTRDSGIGDLAIRWKQNLFGNDGGPVAMALMPFVQAPLQDFDADLIEGGLIVPVAIEGPAGFGFGVMGEIDLRRQDGTGGDHQVEFIASGTASHAIAGGLGGYLEIYSLTRADAGLPWTGTFDVGLTYGVGENFQLDTGANFGLSRESEDVAIFVGFSARR